MNEGPVDGEGTVIAHHESAEVAEPSEGALHPPASLIASQDASILGRCMTAVRAMGCDQRDAPSSQPLAQPVAVVAFVRDHPLGLLSWSAGSMAPTDADCLQRFLREPDLTGRGRVKSHSQRKTRAVDHHHPLRPLAPLGFADGVAPFLAGAKLPSKKASLHFTCWRSFNSARNARQRVSQTSCSSQSRNRRQQVDGEGNSWGKSCQRAPLRRTHKMPSSTLRSSARGRPPRGRRGRFGSKGRIFSHWASVNSRPYRAIRPPPGASPPPREHIHCKTNALYPVLKWLLGTSRMRSADLKVGATIKSEIQNCHSPTPNPVPRTPDRSPSWVCAWTPSRSPTLSNR